MIMKTELKIKPIVPSLDAWDKFNEMVNKEYSKHFMEYLLYIKSLKDKREAKR